MALLGWAASATAGNNRWSRGTPEWGPENIFSLAVSHHDSRVYAGSRLRVFISADGGESWTTSDLGLGDSCCEPGLVVVDPRNSYVVYALTNARGIIKSRDGGRTWAFAGEGLPPSVSSSPLSLAVDPVNTDTLYAAYDGVYKSEDGGGSWRQVFVGGVTAIAIDPVHPAVVYASDLEAGVVKSLDGGQNWIFATDGLPSRPFITSLVIDPREPSTLFAGATDGVFRSVDGAAHWSRLEGFPQVAPTALAIDPLDSRIVWAVGFDTTGQSSVFRSVDRGETWSVSLTAAPAELLRVVAVSPLNFVLAGGSDLRKTTDGGHGWEVASTPAAVGGSSLLADASLPTTIFAAGGTQRVSRSDDSGRTWVEASEGLPAEPIVSLQQERPGSVLFALSSTAIYESRDRGIRWEFRMPLEVAGEAVRGTLVDPDDVSTVYVRTSSSCYQGFCYESRVRVSNDEGVNWTELARAGPAFQKLYLTPGPDPTLYALNGNIWRGDAVSGLAEVVKGPVDGVSARIAELAIDPTDPLVGYAFPFFEDFHFRGPIHRSTDAFETWTPISDGPETRSPETAVLIDPAMPTTLYLSTLGNGVFRSTDGGATWSQLGDGLADPHVRSLSLSADGKTLYAGTDHAVYQYTFCDACPPLVEPRPTPRVLPPRRPAEIAATPSIATSWILELQRQGYASSAGGWVSSRPRRS